MQEDRAGYAGGGNLYAYVNGDVLQARDPAGLYRRDTYPDYCCAGSNWDGWFGITGTLLGAKVNYATVYFEGGVIHCILELTCLSYQEYTNAVLAFLRSIQRNEAREKVYVNGKDTGLTTRDAATGGTQMPETWFDYIIAEFGAGTDRLAALAGSIFAQLRAGSLFVNDALVGSVNTFIETPVDAFSIGDITVLSQGVARDPQWAVAHEQYHRPSFRDWGMSKEGRINWEVNRVLGRCPNLGYPVVAPAAGWNCGR